MQSYDEHLKFVIYLFGLVLELGPEPDPEWPGKQNRSLDQDLIDPNPQHFS